MNRCNKCLTEINAPEKSLVLCPLCGALKHIRQEDCLNLVRMNPQPLLTLDQVKSNNRRQWCRWERGQGSDEMVPLLNQPSSAVGVMLSKGTWYWLVDD